MTARTTVQRTRRVQQWQTLTSGPVARPLIVEGGDTYNGPVFGENASIESTVFAWGQAQVRQISYRSTEVAPGYEELAHALNQALENLPSSSLNVEENEDAVHSVREILDEVAQDKPDEGRMRRIGRSLLQILSPVARGTASGVEAGAHAWAQGAVEQLSKLPQIGA